MAWLTNFATGADVQKWAHFIQFPKAIREREWALGRNPWPRQSAVWETGTIGTVTATTLRDITKTWVIEPPRWVSYVNEDVPYLPANYDVVLNCDDLDPSRHVKAQITSHTADTLTFNTIVDSVTAGWIPSISWLSGKAYKIIGRGGLDWSDRWPREPNEREKWRGDIANAISVTLVAGSFSPPGDYVGKKFKDGAIEGIIREQRSDGTLVVDWLSANPSGSYQILDGTTEIATGSTSSLKDGLWRIEAAFPPAAFDGQDLMIYQAHLSRITVTTNTSTTIEFARQAIAYNGSLYSVVATGARCTPGRPPDHPGRWYGGADASFYTHRPPDPLFSAGISTVKMPITSKVWSSGAVGFCEDVTHAAFDVDLWSEIDEECSPADRCYSPDFFKTIRSWQQWVELNCYSFVPTGIYDGATAIPNYTPARLFKRIGAGYVGTFSTSSDGDGNYSFSISGVGEFDDYFYTVVDPRGDNGESGKGTGTTRSFTGGQPSKTYQMIVARGWKRRHPREFQHAYPRSAFIPDIETSEFGVQSVVVPPTNKYPGFWEDRAASTVYAESNATGFTNDIGQAFITGTRARYLGDNWGDPGVYPHEQPGTGGPLDMLYYRNLWLGRFNAEARIGYDPKKSGRITYGGRKWFRQDDHNWWGAPNGGGDPIIIHSGTATSGSSSTLSDTTQYYEPEDYTPPDPLTMVPFWADGPRFIGMMLEVAKTVTDEDDVDHTIVYHSPIIAHSSDSTTVTFAAVPAFIIPAVPATTSDPAVAAIHCPALSVSTGDAYTIREPHRRNWFAGRTVRITKPGVGYLDKTITHHDKDHLWFDTTTDFDIDHTCSFLITELNPGHVYSWNGTKWVEVVGLVPERKGNQLRPGLVTKYGNVMKGDYIGGHVWKQLYDALNELVWTKAGVDWRKQSPDVAPTYNEWGQQTNGAHKYNQFVALSSSGHSYIDGESPSATQARIWNHIREVYGWGNLDYIGGGFPIPEQVPATRSDSSHTIPQLWGSDEMYRSGGFGEFPAHTDDFATVYEVAFQPAVAGVPTYMACSRHAYAYTEKMPGLGDDPEGFDEYINAFSAHGVHAAEDRWSIVDSAGASSDSETVWDYWPVPVSQSGSGTPGSDYVNEPSGSPYPVDIPIDVRASIPPTPVEGELVKHTFKQRGFRATQAVCILKWDVEGGLTYVKPPPAVSMRAATEGGVPAGFGGELTQAQLFGSEHE